MPVSAIVNSPRPCALCPSSLAINTCVAPGHVFGSFKLHDRSDEGPSVAVVVAPVPQSHKNPKCTAKCRPLGGEPVSATNVVPSHDLIVSSPPAKITRLVNVTASGIR